MRNPRVSLEPLVVMAFASTRLRSPAITTAPVALTHLPSGRRLGSTRRMTCRLSKASNPSTPRLLGAAYHWARPPLAARRSGSSQEKRRELRSLTSPCAMRRAMMPVAAFERFRRALAVSSGDQQLVLDGTRACGSSGPAGGQEDVRGVL